GVLIAGLWGWYATDRPEQHPGVNQGELTHIQGESASTPSLPLVEPVPWRAFARTPSVWWLVTSYTGLGYVAYVYMSWFYLYLVNERGFGVLRGAFFASGPFLAMTVLCPLGGWVTDRVAASVGVKEGRSRRRSRPGWRSASAGTCRSASPPGSRPLAACSGCWSSRAMG